MGWEPSQFVVSKDRARHGAGDRAVFEGRCAFTLAIRAHDRRAASPDSGYRSDIETRKPRREPAIRSGDILPGQQSADRAADVLIIAHLVDNFSGDNRGKRRVLPVKKSCKSIEGGESLVRPFELHRLRQFRNAGVPHVWSHRTTSSFAATESCASNAFQRRSSSAMSPTSASAGPASSVANSATSSGTLRPRSAARCLSTIAVSLSISIVSVFIGIL